MSQMSRISRMSNKKRNMNEVTEFTEFSIPKIKMFLYSFKTNIPNMFTIF